MRSVISANMDKLYQLGVLYIGIFSHILDNENDLEVYIIPDEKGYNWFRVEELLQNLFPDLKIKIYDEQDRYALDESVICGIQFC